MVFKSEKLFKFLRCYTQLGNMKCVVAPAELFRELQPISHLAHPGNNPERPNIVGTQLSLLPEMDHTLLG